MQQNAQAGQKKRTSKTVNAIDETEPGDAPEGGASLQRPGGGCIENLLVDERFALGLGADGVVAHGALAGGSGDGEERVVGVHDRREEGGGPRRRAGRRGERSASAAWPCSNGGQG